MRATEDPVTVFSRETVLTASNSIVSHGERVCGGEAQCITSFTSWEHREQIMSHTVRPSRTLSSPRLPGQCFTDHCEFSFLFPLLSSMSLSSHCPTLPFS